MSKFLHDGDEDDRALTIPRCCLPLKCGVVVTRIGTQQLRQVYKCTCSTVEMDSLKWILLQVLSEPEFYGDLVYKFRKIIGKNDFPYHFKKIIVRYKKIGYNINVMRQTACLVVNPIKVNSFAYLFNCTRVGRTLD